MKKIVLTGGPCAGKSSVLAALEHQLSSEATFVPESISQLFRFGWPTPTAEWTNTEWSRLQRANTVRQLALETLAETEAEARDCALVITDRGLFDNLAYPMGEAAVQELQAINPTLGHRRYHLVIHLESLATAQPHRYGKAGNETRYESLAEAQALELRARAAWDGHPNWVQLDGRHTVAELTAQVMHHIRSL